MSAPNRTHRSMLISLEGIDGSGKSTLARDLAAHLTGLGYNVVLTKEPGGSQLGKKLRELLQLQPVPITPQAEFLLFAADRAQHFNDVVIPALRSNNIVISDRMADSSLVYQGYGRGLDKKMIQTINAWVMNDIRPDLTFYLHITAETAAKRLAARAQLTKFEKEQEQFAQNLIAGFDQIFKDRDDVITLDGTLSPNTLTNQAAQEVESWISSPK